MPLRAVLIASNEPITSVFFPKSGYASLLAMLEDGDAAEVGLIWPGGHGRSPIGFRDRPGSYGSHGPVSGHSSSVARGCVSAGTERSSSSTKAHAELRNGFQHPGNDDRRLQWQTSCRPASRALVLMAHYRTEGDQFPMTHEFLSLMRGVRRAGVTVAAGMLQKACDIRYHRDTFVCSTGWD
jgi:CRP-like cAMP-binding protein